MKRVLKKLVPRKSIPALGLWALAACAGGGGSGCNNDTDDGSARSPFRDDWRVVADQAFEHTAADGTPQIFDLTIGGREENENFANRGDVIVNFDGPANRILIEMRRFTFNTNQEAADVDFEKLALWASDAPPGGPTQPEEEDDCIVGGWRTGCEVRVLYDGLSQLARSGADLRVTLPPDYRYKINVITQDNIEEEDYLNRGNVCVSNLFASASIEVESGKVWAALAPEVTPAPKCSQEQIDKCENWTVEDDMGNTVPAPWAPECDCIAVGGGEFGRLEINSREDTAADITVDMPDTTWLNATVANQSEAKPHECKPVIDNCSGSKCVMKDNGEYSKAAEFNYPSEAAPSGAGFNLTVFSAGCTQVDYFKDAEDWDVLPKLQERVERHAKIYADHHARATGRSDGETIPSRLYRRNATTSRANRHDNATGRHAGVIDRKRSESRCGTGIDLAGLSQTDAVARAAGL